METQSRDTSLDAERIRVERIRQQNVSQRGARMLSLTSTAVFLSRRAIRRANPGISKREEGLLFVAAHYGKALADKVRDYLNRQDGQA